MPARIVPTPESPRAQADINMVKELVFISGFVSLLATAAFADEESLLARVTVYWPGEGGYQACFNGMRLRPGHCAVDPKKIPYGSKVYFPDGPCVAVDTGPAVVSRKAARLIGRNSRERSALVIDRFFESKEQALAWERTHPHFMTLRVAAPRSRSKPAEELPPATLRIVQTIVPLSQTSAPPPIPQSSAPPLVMRRELELAVTATFSTPKRSLVSAPPSYHRRRFAADANDQTEVPPPTCSTTPPLKRSRVV